MVRKGEKLSEEHKRKIGQGVHRQSTRGPEMTDGPIMDAVEAPRPHKDIRILFDTDVPEDPWFSTKEALVAAVLRVHEEVLLEWVRAHGGARTVLDLLQPAEVTVLHGPPWLDADTTLYSIGPIGVQVKGQLWRIGGEEGVWRRIKDIPRLICVLGAAYDGSQPA